MFSFKQHPIEVVRYTRSKDYWIYPIIDYIYTGSYTTNPNINMRLSIFHIHDSPLWNIDILPYKSKSFAFIHSYSKKEIYMQFSLWVSKSWFEEYEIILNQLHNAKGFVKYETEQITYGFYMTPKFHEYCDSIDKISPKIIDRKDFIYTFKDEKEGIYKHEFVERRLFDTYTDCVETVNEDSPILDKYIVRFSIVVDDLEINKTLLKIILNSLSI